MSTGMKTVLVIAAAAAALAITVFAVTERRGFSALFLNALGGMAARDLRRAYSSPSTAGRWARGRCSECPE